MSSSLSDVIGFLSLSLSRIEEPMSVVPRPGEVKLLPLEMRVAHFREMMLERGVIHTHTHSHTYIYIYQIKSNYIHTAQNHYHMASVGFTICTVNDSLRTSIQGGKTLHVETKKLLTERNKT